MSDSHPVLPEQVNSERLWPGLLEVLVAGGAKDLFTRHLLSLTRIAGGAPARHRVVSPGGVGSEGTELTGRAKIAGSDDLRSISGDFQKVRQWRFREHVDPPSPGAQARQSDAVGGVGEHGALVSFGLGQFRHLSGNQ